MALFQDSVINKYQKCLDKQRVSSAYAKFKAHFLNPEVQENIRDSKEEQYQEGFLSDLFVKILGYTKNPDPDYNLTTEYKNVKDSKKADGAIIVNGVVKTVIELKGADTTDLNKIENQAFGYKNNQPECVYVIISNFEKLRLYIDNAIEHIEFNLFNLSEEDFERLFLCLAWDNFKNDMPKKIKEESLSQEDKITKELYNDYSLFKRELHKNLVDLNPDHTPLELFKKSQKLLDRFLFLFFAEDRSLLPPNSVRLILSDWRDLQERDVDVSLYDRFKQYFGYLNNGYQGKRYDVFAYNGGLFKPDEILDSVTIDSELLYEHTFKLSKYNYASEVDVNILGHIFENSLNELEEIKAQLEGKEIDKSRTKRKKDGVFYTPKYITKYIVDNTLGRLCSEKKAELKIIDEEFELTTEARRSKKQREYRDQRQARLDKYREWLLSLTILDPACGSGAFLNQALNFLIEEHGYIDELNANLNRSALIFQDVENRILENNIFGVDLNEESVEIAKLSLWLRSAHPNRKLNDLNSNIKCGNSLIDDPAVAGEKAFHWQKEFPQVFEKGGFDIVIGNPPWGAELTAIDKTYLKSKFQKIDSSTPNSFAYFMGLCHSLADKIGLIVPDSYLLKDFEKTRQLFKNGTSALFWLQNTSMPEDERPFQEVDHDVVVIIYNKNEDNKEIFYSLRLYQSNQIILKSFKRKLKEICDEKYFNIYNLVIDDFSIKIKDKFSSYSTIASICQIHEGIHSGNCREKLFLSEKRRGDEKPMFLGGKSGDIIDNFLSYRGGWFVDYRKEAINEDIGEYASLRDENIFKLPKVYITRTGNPFKCFIDERNYASNNFFSLQTKNLSNNTLEELAFFVSLLNSRFSQYYIRKIIAPRIGNSFVETKIIHLLKLPVPPNYASKTKDFKEKVDNIIEAKTIFRELLQKFIRMIQRKFEMEELPKKLQDWYLLSYAEFIKELGKKKIKLSLSDEAEWERYFMQESQKALDLKSKIDSTDKTIDKMVYELYGLTDEEIKIVEGS